MKKKKGGQLELAAGVAVEASRSAAELEQRPAEIKAVMVFQDRVTRVPMVVKRCDLLCAEISLAPEQLSEFWDLLQSRSEMMPRACLICRRLFGIMPVVAPPETPLDDLRVWEREDLAQTLGIAVKELGHEVQAVAAAWKVFKERRQADVAAKAEVPLAATGVTLLDKAKDDADFLLRHRFDPGMFRVGGRDEKVSASEREWFVDRARRLDVQLTHPYAGETVRQLLMTELRMQREEAALMREDFTTDEGAKRYGQWKARLDETQNRHAELLNSLNEVFGWVGQANQASGLKNAISDLVKGYQEYMADGRNHLLDGVRTACEIQVECRASKQAPDVMFRAGLTTYIQEARANLWNRKYRSQIPIKLLSRLDKAWAESFHAIRKAEGEELPDLLSDDPVKGEYPPIFRPESAEVLDQDTITMEADPGDASANAKD